MYISKPWARLYWTVHTWGNWPVIAWCMSQLVILFSFQGFLRVGVNVCYKRSCNFEGNDEWIGDSTFSDVISLDLSDIVPTTTTTTATSSADIYAQTNATKEEQVSATVNTQISAVVIICSVLMIFTWDKRAERAFASYITKTCLYNFDPLKPHFYIVKLGFTGIYIIFLISAQKHTLWVLVRTASSRRF